MMYTKKLGFTCNVHSQLEWLMILFLASRDGEKAERGTKSTTHGANGQKNIFKFSSAFLRPLVFTGGHPATVSDINQSQGYIYFLTWVTPGNTHGFRNGKREFLFLGT